MAPTTPARAMDPAARKLRRTGLILLILLAAAGLRLYALADAPPGMTHDEADHGLTAWEIVNGARGIYFTVGYGREPLYDYATALLMAGTGPTILAARLVSVYFSLLMIAAVYAWARRAFGAPVALLAAAGLAVGFWPVMAGRQALRSIALPAVFALAALAFWHGAVEGEKGGKGAEVKGSAPSPLLPFSLSPFLLSGLLLGLSFYTYIPARVMWLALPALAGYVALVGPRAGRRRLLGGTVLTLATAALVGAPLFVYLLNNPGLEVRIDELSAPLAAARGGDFGPLWANARGALRLFTVEGDQTWRYNIPGKPFLGPVVGVLFYVGVVVAGWLVIMGFRNRVFKKKLGFAAGAFLSLVWLVMGFAPVLITGPGLATTQAIGALPVLYVFPALAVYGLFVALRRVVPWSAARSARGLAMVCGLLVLALAALTTRDYFGRWANAPEVRVQYEATMVAALRYLDEHGAGAAAVSTITPGRYHTPAVALLTLRNPAVRPRWFDGRESLLLPDDGVLVVPGFTPIPAPLLPYLDDAPLVDELPMRPDDLDRPVRVYALDGADAALSVMTTTAATETLPLQFGEHLQLLGYALPAAEARPGEALPLVTAWRLEQPLPDASLFAHLVGPGEPPAVADSLGAPGEAWVAGDVLLQLHTLILPADLPAGEYPLAVGVYTRHDRQRLLADNGQDMVTLTYITVNGESGDE